MKLLLDTNAYAELRRGNESVAEWVRDAERVFFSTVVAGELMYGFHGGSRFEANVKDLRAFLGSPYVQLVPVSWTTAERFGRIFAALRKKGTPIPTNDVWIAAHAMELGADLLSFDAHFQHVDGLVWRNPSH